MNQATILAKKTVKNQLTLPKVFASRYADVDYFEVSEDEFGLRLKPLRPSRADEVRAKLARLGITDQDLSDAVAWARERE